LVIVNGKKFVPCEAGTKVMYVSESHVLLQCPETQRWREELLNSKWLRINEESERYSLSKMSPNKENLISLCTIFNVNGIPG
jgi:hypothetical protein